MSAETNQIACGIDFHHPGLQISYLHLSHSDNERALSVIPVLIAQIERASLQVG